MRQNTQAMADKLGPTGILRHLVVDFGVLATGLVGTMIDEE